jgi:hypothetical protein
MSTLSGGPNIVTNGLVFSLDAANPKSYVSGSTTWNDISRGGNNGTLINGPTFNSGNYGSIVFDGVDDYVIVPNNQIFNVNDNFTINIWFKSTAWTTNNQEGIISKGSLTNWVTYLRGTNGTISFYTSGTNFWAPGPDVGGTNLWNNVSFIYSFSNLGYKQIYYNGVFYAQQSVTVPITINTDDLRIGFSQVVSSPQYLKGQVSVTTFYNRVLSSSEILQNFNAQKSRFGI